METQESSINSSILLVLGEVKGDVKALVQAHAQTNRNMEKLEQRSQERYNEVVDRLSVLERFRSRTVGIYLGAATVAGFVANYISDLFKVGP